VADSREPRGGVPALITSDSALAEYAVALAGGDGPLALDAERASGYRYSQRAYLIQLRREGAGTALIDPTMVTSMAPIQQATEGVEWILHAATQDLPCLAEVGLRPTALFDTELAGRLLGRERVGLSWLVESELGEHLEKGHGSADWSLRPLSAEQLRYAALDVEWLVELRAVLHRELEAAGKLRWAMEEFTALLDFTPRDRGEEPWRRTSGIHRIRKPRALAVVRGLWLARDEVAARTDIAPGRVLPDAAIVAAATNLPTSIEELIAIKEFSGKGQQRRSPTWWAAIESARALPDIDLPEVASPSEGPPPPRTWPDRNPEAAARLHQARALLTEISERLSVPLENLISPDLVRRVCWDPPAADQVAVQEILTRAGARPWQVELAAPVLVAALAESALERPEAPPDQE
jgi:ribonuclease D